MYDVPCYFYHSSSSCFQFFFVVYDGGAIMNYSTSSKRGRLKTTLFTLYFICF